jgi:hypothetical protein
MGGMRNATVNLGIIAVIFVVIVVIVAIVIDLDEKPATQNESSKQVGNQKMQTNKQVIEFIQNYKGKDNSGKTLLEVMSMIIATAYPNEKILENPSTTVGFYALPIPDEAEGIRNWSVEFSLETYRESTSFEWIVDTETNSVYAKSANSADILNVLDAYD